MRDALYSMDHAGASSRVRFDSGGELVDPVVLVKEARGGQCVEMKSAYS